MKEKFRDIIDRAVADLEEKKFLLAVSGGVDSVALAHLFYETKLNFAIAHCNFMLRDEDSELDQELVKKTAARYDVRFFIERFQTSAIAAENGVSVQMAARELRYEWLKSITRKNKYDFIVTAHHRNDQVETFFINLTRGTGLEGLTGMKTCEGKLLRPLLSFSKTELEDYAAKNKLKWREDKSNREVKYTRNKIRLEIIPKFEEINPAFVANVAGCMEILDNINIVYRKIIEEKKEKYLVKNDFGHEIDLRELKKEITPLPFLYEMLKPFHFNYATVKDIFSERVKETGKKFFSNSHRVVNHRGVLLITKLIAEDLETFEISEKTTEITHPVHLLFERTTKKEIIKSDKIAQLDASRIKFPLMIRKWYRGDSFFPLGMKGRKKLSDFFIDNKYSLVEKENIHVLVSGDQVIWVIGKRIDDRYKITESTTEVMTVKMV